MCWKCGNERQQMTTWSNNYPLPCWDCVGTSKADIQAAQKVVLDYYREIHEKASKDKFFQYFLTVSDEENYAKNNHCSADCSVHFQRRHGY